MLVNAPGPLSVSERGPRRLNKSKRKISTPPTTNSFSSSADETSRAILISSETQKTPHERQEKEHNIRKAEETFVEKLSRSE